jgi:hypothetical protein
MNETNRKTGDNKSVTIVDDDVNLDDGSDNGQDPESANPPRQSLSQKTPLEDKEEEDLSQDDQESTADFSEFVHNNDGDDFDAPTGGKVSEESKALDSSLAMNQSSSVRHAATPLIQFDTIRPPLQRKLVGSISRRDHRQSFWGRMDDESSVATLDTQKTGKGHNRKKSDLYFDYSEANKELLTFLTSSGDMPVKVDIPSLQTCRHKLQNKEADRHRKKSRKWYWRVADTFMNILAAFYIYVVNILGFEAFAVMANTGLTTYFYCVYAEEYAVKLDFAFLSLAVVFPLTFLIQSTFARRDLALLRLLDFKSAVLSSALFELSVDWESSDGKRVGGRAELPPGFNKNVLFDYEELLQLVYQYLSMPSVSHARYLVFFPKQRKSRRIHALQNDLLKKINDNMYDLMMHTEAMRSAGFSSGEASRLAQYHQYIQQRFEHLRTLKYYRTPQATRSFGRAYIYILPWLSGPYFAWVFQSTNSNMAFTITLAIFTFLILLGLLNTQQSLEDPYTVDVNSWTPGIDSVKVGYELAIALQAISQYYANAELHRRWAQEKRNEE